LNKKNCLIIFLAVAVYTAGYVYSQWTSYHNFEGMCLDCHLTVPGNGDAPLTFVKDISSMCYTCHPDSRTLSHPVDMPPSMKVPADFLLDWSGKMTCASCHPVHKQGNGPFHLRSRKSGQGLCMDCHNDFENALHKLSIGTAHVGAATNSGYMADELGDVLDRLSIQCLACHDAIFGADSLVENLALRRQLFHNSNSIGLSHPIGMSYYETKRKYRGAYRTVSELPKEIQLFGGIVGCGTCHNPYSKLHSELVMSNAGSALCLACHVK